MKGPLFNFRATAVRRWPQLYGFRGSEAFTVLYKTVKLFFLNRNPIARHNRTGIAQSPAWASFGGLAMIVQQTNDFRWNFCHKNRSASARKIHGLRTTCRERTTKGTLKLGNVELKSEISVGLFHWQMLISKFYFRLQKN